MTTNKVEPFSVNQINRTKKGFTEIREGFAPSNPNVGTITHEFDFATDPWQIISTDGNILITLSSIKLSVSKVFNPNNTTDSFYVLSWNPNYNYYSDYAPAPNVLLHLLDANGATLNESSLGGLGIICGISTRQSKRGIINPMYFDRISIGVFSLGPSRWYKC